MYNIYHFLMSEAGSTTKTNLLSAMDCFKKNIFIYGIYETAAVHCLETLWRCNFIDFHDYNELREQLNYLMKLYKCKRGSSLGRKDVK